MPIIYWSSEAIKYHKKKKWKKKQSIIETRVIIKVKKAPLTKQNKKYKEILSMKKGENCKWFSDWNYTKKYIYKLKGHHQHYILPFFCVFFVAIQIVYWKTKQKLSCDKNTHSYTNNNKFLYFYFCCCKYISKCQINCWHLDFWQ